MTPDTTRVDVQVRSETIGRHELAAAGYANAAARCHEFGVPYEEAQALLGQGALPGGARQSGRGGDLTRRGAPDLRNHYSGSGTDRHSDGDVAEDDSDGRAGTAADGYGDRQPHMS